MQTNTWEFVGCLLNGVVSCAVQGQSAADAASRLREHQVAAANAVERSGERRAADAASSHSALKAVADLRRDLTVEQKRTTWLGRALASRTAETQRLQDAASTANISGSGGQCLPLAQVCLAGSFGMPDVNMQPKCRFLTCAD